MPNFKAPEDQHVKIEDPPGRDPNWRLCPSILPFVGGTRCKMGRLHNIFPALK